MVLIEELELIETTTRKPISSGPGNRISQSRSGKGKDFVHGSDERLSRNTEGNEKLRKDVDYVLPQGAPKLVGLYGMARCRKSKISSIVLADFCEQLRKSLFSSVEKPRNHVLSRAPELLNPVTSLWQAKNLPRNHPDFLAPDNVMGKTVLRSIDGANSYDWKHFLKPLRLVEAERIFNALTPKIKQIFLDIALYSPSNEGYKSIFDWLCRMHDETESRMNLHLLKLQRSHLVRINKDALFVHDLHKEMAIGLTKAANSESLFLEGQTEAEIFLLMRRGRTSVTRIGFSHCVFTSRTKLDFSSFPNLAVLKLLRNIGLQKASVKRNIKLMSLEVQSNDDLTVEGLDGCGSPSRLYMFLQLKKTRLSTLCKHLLPFPVYSSHRMCRHLIEGEAFLGRKVRDDSKLKFVFPSAESMARIVGVGVPFGEVILCKDLQVNSPKKKKVLRVKIEVLRAKDWEHIWEEALHNRSMYTPIAYNSQQHKKKFKMPVKPVLTGKEAALLVGVGLDGLQYSARTPIEESFDELTTPCLLQLVELFLATTKEPTNSKCRRNSNECQGSNATHNNENGEASSSEGTNSKQGPLANLRDWLGSTSREGGGGDGDGNGNGEGLDVGRSEDKDIKRAFSEVTVNLSSQISDLPDGFDGFVRVSMTPTLIFTFQREKRERSIKIVATLVCELGGAAPKIEEEHRFGWYQDKISVSMQCKELDGARMVSPDYEKNDADIVKANTKQSTTSGKQMGYGLGLGIQQIVKATGNTSFTTTSTRTSEEAQEIPFMQQKGFVIRDLSTTHDSRMWFVAEQIYAPPDKLVLDKELRKRFMALGMCNRFEKKVWAVWEPWNEKTDAPYIFEAGRDLIEKTLALPAETSRIKNYMLGCFQRNNATTSTTTATITSSSSIHNGIKTRKRKQIYQQSFLVNHAMTHLDGTHLSLHPARNPDHRSRSHLLRVCQAGIQGEIHDTI